MTVTEDFTRLTDPFRRELLAHCYRMLGSVHDAEDLVQDTYLRAWRSYAEFEGRASLRTWLYKIATNASLSMLERRDRRPLPSGLGPPDQDPQGPLTPPPVEVAWLQPVPDALLDHEAAADPAAIVAAREGTRLAMVAALQYLPPRQRAVLILRDVLRWRAAEVADLLDTSPTAVNSLLQRARTQLRDVAPDLDNPGKAPADPDQRDLLDRYVKAFETVDIPALMDLLTRDATWEMPPRPNWYVGAAEIAHLIAYRCPPGSRLLPTRANGAPAFGFYTPETDTTLRGRAITVLTLAGAHINRIVAFHDPALFPTFGLPLELSAEPLIR